MPETLLRQFDRHPLTTEHPNGHMLYECLASVARIVLDSRTDLQEDFLRLVVNGAKRVPQLAWQLLDSFLAVVGEDPIRRSRLLVRLVEQMGSRYARGDLFLQIHRAFDEWIDSLAPKGQEPALRRIQETIVPLLLGHQSRPTRLSALPERCRVEALIRLVGSEPPDGIVGRVRDISGGDDDRLGCGIHIHSKEWTFATGPEDCPYPPRPVVATRVGSNEVRLLKETTVELRYSNPLATAEFKAACVRGFTYKKRYGLSGGGIVLMLENDNSPAFRHWREFVRTNLGELTYSDRVA